MFQVGSRHSRAAPEDRGGLCGGRSRACRDCIARSAKFGEQPSRVFFFEKDVCLPALGHAVLTKKDVRSFGGLIELDVRHES
jgi:hypothetical protein